MSLRRARQPVIWLLVVLVIHHIAVWFAQRAMLFPGALMEQRFTLPPENVETIAAGGSRALFLPAATTTTAAPGPLVVYAHGNAEFAEDFFLLREPYTAAGFHVLVLEYRGFGAVPGSPSEDAIVADSVALIEAACARPDVDGTRVVYHGRSLGGAVLGTVSGVRPPSRLVLEAAFSSVPSMARRFLVPRYLLRDRFDVPLAVAGGSFPVLQLHSRDDEVVPFTEATIIAAALPPDRLTRAYVDGMSHQESWLTRDPERLVAFALGQ